MYRIISSTFILISLSLLLFSCQRKGPEWVALPSSEDLLYQVLVRTYTDGAYADQPFSVRVVSKINSKRDSVPITAAQCRNVKIAQTKDIVYIFYDELVLDGFSSMQYGYSLPRPILCDMRQEYCQDMLKSIVSSNEILSNVCTFK